MPLPSALIRHLTLHATASDAGDALRVLEVAEAVIRRAVEAAAAQAGDEIVVLRRVELDFAVDLDGAHALSGSQMESALRTAIVRPIQRARAEGSSVPVIGEHAAWFPNEGSAIGELLIAHARGRAGSFPYESLTLWGATPDALLGGCLDRDRALLGDVLAGASRELDDALLGLMGDDLAARIVAAYTEGDSDRTIAASALPADLRAAIAEAIGRAAFASSTQRDVMILARLFARWPPARDARTPLAELRMIAEPARGADGATPGQVLGELLRGSGADLDRLPDDAVATLLSALRAPRDGALDALWSRLEGAGIPTAELRRAVEGSARKRLVSAAGGLVAWSSLFAAEGLSSAIDDASSEPRIRRALRWAIGCALEDARIGGVDPMLFLWAGEDVEAPLVSSMALTSADPAPLHRCALRFAEARGLLGGALDAAPFGDMITLTGENGFCVDAVPGADAGGAVPELVRRFVHHIGRSPEGIRVTPRMSDDAIDAWTEVDAPLLPDPFRPAVRAFASSARAALLARWGSKVSDLRRWPAIVETGSALAVEIAKGDVTRVRGGTWLGERVTIGTRAVVVRMK